MDWKNFIQPMCKTEIFNKAAPKIIDELFAVAGRKNDFSESTAKSWLNGTRNCKAISYFPDSKVDTEEIFRWFKRRPPAKLQHLQQIFQDTVNLDPDSPIDVTTDNLDTFCWSLVDQFLDLLCFPRVGSFHTTASPAGESVGAGQLLDDQRADMPKDVSLDEGRNRDHQQALEKSSTQVPEQQVATEPTSLEPMVNIADSKRFLEDRKCSIRSMLLPHSDDCCYHCDHWKGKRSTFGAYTKALPGNCEWHNGQQRLSSDPPCQNYKKRQSQPGDW